MIQSLLGSLFLALRTTLALMRSQELCAYYNDNGRRLSSQDYASITRAQC